MDRIRCAACGELFTPRHNVPDQKYCSKPECHRERRRCRQRQKLKEDPDYRANQAAAAAPGARSRSTCSSTRRKIVSTAVTVQRSC